MTMNLKKWMTAVAVTGLGMTGTAVAQQGQQPSEPWQEDQAQQQQQGQQEQGQQQAQTKQRSQDLSGTVASTEGGQLYIESKQGAVIPFAVGGDTQFKGQRMEGEALTSTEQLQAGDEVKVSFTPMGEENQATEIQLKKGQKEQSLSGKVASTTGDTIMIEHQGALVPLQVNEKTKFSGKTEQGETLNSADQIQEGAQVRASFRVQNETDNVASSIKMTSKAQKKMRK